VAVVGHTQKTEAFSQTYQAEALDSWMLELNLDLVIVSLLLIEIMVRSHIAPSSGKHVVVEYPLCLDVAEARLMH